MGEVGVDHRPTINLLDLPRPVIILILSRLSLNDLLRARRTSKTLKTYTDKYLRVCRNSEAFFKISITNLENLDALVATDFVAPLTRFKIECLYDVVEAERVQNFLHIYGERVTWLTISYMNIPIISPKVVSFFESFPNLKKLKIHRANSGDATKLVGCGLIPSSFKRLQSLIILDYECYDLEAGSVLLWEFVSECSAHLEELAHPPICCGFDFFDYCAEHKFEHVLKLLESPDRCPLRFYDLEQVTANDDRERASADFYDLIIACSRRNVKLLNVNSMLIEDLMQDPMYDKVYLGRKISSVVTSLNGLNKSSFLMEFAHLEQISLYNGGVNTMNCCMPGVFSFQRQPWSNLREVDIWLDSNRLYDCEQEDYSCITSSTLLDFFFEGIRRENMRVVKLSFDVQISCPPKIINISQSCPNLKVLTLRQWEGNCLDLACLWTNLPQLEDATLKACSFVGIEAFVGNDSGNPAFLHQNNLQSLALDCLADMPGIKDDLFAELLRHKGLKKLRLSSDETISHEGITLAGLSWLLDGRFSETVERLSLKIKLEQATAIQVNELEMKFRSWKML